MNEQDDLSPDMRNAIAQFNVSFEDPGTPNPRSYRRYDPTEVIIPAAIRRYLPDDTQLHGTMLQYEELGSRASVPGLSLTMPFGPTSAEPIFRR